MIGPPSLAVKTSHFSEPVYVQDKPMLTKHEKKTLLRKASKIADEWIEFGYEVYSSRLSENFDQLYDLTIKHFLQIREIENAAITAGKTRAEVIEESNRYVQSVIGNVAPK